MADEPAWLPDGEGLPAEAVALIAGQTDPKPVHLRLTSPDGRYPRSGCGGGLGEWWSGKAAEVTCGSCLELVHA